MTDFSLWQYLGVLVKIPGENRWNIPIRKFKGLVEELFINRWTRSQGSTKNSTIHQPRQQQGLLTWAEGAMSAMLKARYRQDHPEDMWLWPRKQVCRKKTRGINTLTVVPALLDSLLDSDLTESETRSQGDAWGRIRVGKSVNWQTTYLA